MDRVTGTSLLALFFSLSCKPVAKSSVESLDNAVYGKYRDNRCQLSETVESYAAAPAAARILPPLGKTGMSSPEKFITAAKNTLTAVPQKIQELFVELGGTITIADNAAEICGSFYKDENGNSLFVEVGEVDSCAVFLPESPKNRRILNIVVAPDVGVIQHGLLRAFSALLTEYFPRIERVTDGEFRYVAESTRDRSAKRDLALKILEDIHSARGLNFEQMIFAFGNQGVIELVQALDDKKYSDAASFFAQISFRNSDSEDLPEVSRLERENRALNFLVSEAFDSYYCNAWSPADVATIKNVRDGGAKLESLANTYNTREIFEHLFPTAYTAFTTSTMAWAEQMVGERLGNGLSLTAPIIPVQEKNTAPALALAEQQLDSPWWAGTKAFFGSVWDNTGGAVGRGYDNYQQAVGRAVDQVYDGNIASTSAKAIAKVGSDAYSDYYQRTYDKTGQRIDTLQRGGMSATTAQRYGVALAVGDITGFTDAAEAVGGADTQHGRILTSQERFDRGLASVPKIAGTMAGAVSTTTRIAGATRPAGVLCLGPCDQVFATNSQAVQAAQKLGYQRTNYVSSGQTVMKATKKAPSGAPNYITRDVDMHNGGAFKGASSPSNLASKTTRCGTYDACLNRIAD
jgi:hypothetical protein